ncbi:MAG: MFS transporter [Chthoniobacteraceae bacterium]|nr:MFS transporter [Chthoniobacteraceae bacterium]
MTSNIDNPVRSDPAEETQLRMRKGTIQYTRLSLALLFFYLLWGDLVLQLMETVIPSIMPLQLKALGASNTTMGFLLSTLPAFFNLVANPIVSFRSDNFRSAWGRRRPFLFVTTPLVTVTLVLLAFGPDYGQALHHLGFVRHFISSPNTTIILVIAGLLVLFQVFHYCMTPIYYYLFVDVVPDAFMSRFLALFRIVAALEAYLFNTFIYRSALEHTRLIYVGCSAIYGISFLWMCWKVREGDYPPPIHANKLGLIGSIRVYCRECYSHPHYLFFNARNAMAAVGGIVGMYSVFIYRDELGLPLAVIGKTVGITSVISAALLYPMGALCDRYHPIRVLLIAMILQSPLSLLSFFFLHSQNSYFLFQIIAIPISTLITASEMPMFAAVLPRERYGQFGSANQITTSVAIILGSLVAGQFMDWVTAKGTIVSHYRYLYFWGFTCQIGAIVFMNLLYRSWIRHGGPDHYVAPNIGVDSAADSATVSR